MSNNEHEHDINLRSAANLFISSLTTKEKKTHQQAISRFSRWFGDEKNPEKLTVYDISNYAERMPSSDPDYRNKMDAVKSFLTYMKENGLVKKSLATHLKVKKTKNARKTSSKSDSSKQPESISLTEQGYSEVEAELANLKERRVKVIEDIRNAAADKDFRENAPLDAAKEESGYIEGRIIELETILKTAVIIGSNHRRKLKISIGDSVSLHNLDSGEANYYVIASPREIDPAKAMISSESPIGKAIIGRKYGETVEITTPAGILRCQVNKGE